MNYGFLGSGNMATAIIKGILKKKLTSSEQIFVFDTQKSVMASMEAQYGIQCVDSIQQLTTICDVLILAVKPHVLSIVLPEVAIAYETKKPLLISIAAGKTFASMESFFPFPVPMVRVMPNINAQVLESMSGICPNTHATSAQTQIVAQIFDAIGKTVFIEEAQFSYFSAIAGCSPAYAYLFIDSLAKGAHKAGLSKKEAIKIAAQAVLGSAKLLLESDEHPWTLIDNVCSPGGTTIEGICSLESNHFQSTIVAAVNATIEKDKIL